MAVLLFRVTHVRCIRIFYSDLCNNCASPPDTTMFQGCEVSWSAWTRQTVGCEGYMNVAIQTESVRHKSCWRRPRHARGDPGRECMPHITFVTFIVPARHVAIQAVVSLHASARIAGIVVKCFGRRCVRKGRARAISAACKLTKFKWVLGGVGCRCSLFSVTRGVCGCRRDVPHHRKYAVITQIVRNTPNVIRD